MGFQYSWNQRQVVLTRTSQPQEETPRVNWRGEFGDLLRNQINDIKEAEAEKSRRQDGGRGSVDVEPQRTGAQLVGTETQIQ